jgi:hypothetical protein
MRAHPIAIAIAIPLMACRGTPTLSEADLLGTFELVRLDGRELPVRLWEDSVETLVLEEEELAFRPAGRVERYYRFTITHLPSGKVDVSEVTFESEYRIRGRSVEIGRSEPCPPNALCIPNDEGELRNGRLELRSGRWSGAIAVYMAR